MLNSSLGKQFQYMIILFAGQKKVIHADHEEAKAEGLKPSKKPFEKWSKSALVVLQTLYSAHVGYNRASGGRKGGT
jgi:hypothetical protein